MAVSLAEAYQNRHIQVPRYPRTGRPITDLPFAGNNCVAKYNYLPVVRYESLHYSQAPEPGKTYCGTFYYYEPDSTNFLNLGKCLITANKLDAVIQLERLTRGSLPPLIYKGKEILNSGTIPAFFELTNELFNQLNHATTYYILDEDMSPLPGFTTEFLFDYLNDPNQLYHYVDTLYKYMTSNEFRNRSGNVQSYLTFDRLVDLANTRVIPLWTTVIPFESRVNDPQYLIDMTIPELPAASKVNLLYENISTGDYSPVFVEATDFTDQYICRRARELGYDTVLSQRDTGETRVVTEILDVRPRQMSYQSICKERFDVSTHPPKYPTVWFPEYGFMTYTENKS